MISYYETASVDPYYNLAFEEYVFKKRKKNEIIVLLWQNDNTIVIGKYQNSVEEINMDFAAKNGIKIVRRNSGGGAVYHDLGNLNYTIICDKNEEYVVQWQDFLKPLITAIAELDISAEISGRNDVMVNGYKVSGNSQYISGESLLHHGTILIDSNLSVLNSALTRKNKLVTSKAMHSVKGKVINLKECCDKEISVSSFKEMLKKQIFANESVRYGVCTKDDEEKIKRIKNEKYLSWEWNYGKSPCCDVVYEKRFEGGYVRAFLSMDGAVIKKVKFLGDFICKKEIMELEEAMSGLALDEQLEKNLFNLCIDEYFEKITSKDIYSLLFQGED